MKSIRINPLSVPMVLIYDNAFYNDTFNTWAHALTIEEAIDIMEADMRSHRFFSAVATHAETGEILIEIENKED